MPWLTSLLLLAGPLSFDAALARVDASPELEGAASAARARQDGLSTLGALTSNPVLTVQPGFRIDDGTPGLEAQLTLSQSFNLGGLARARRGVAQAEAQRQALEHLSLRQRRRIAVARAWLDTWAAQTAAGLARQEELATRELLARLERAVTSGGVTLVEVSTARAFAAESGALHLEWEGRRVEAGATLAVLLGLPDIASVDGPLPVLSEASFTGLVPDAFLQVRLLDVELRAEQQREAETKALWATQLQVSLQGGQDWPRQWFGNVGVGLTLPFFEHGNRERTAHLAQQRRLEGERRQAALGASVALQVVQHELEHSAETWAMVKGEQWPAAEVAARLEARRYEQGEATLLELTQLKRQALQARIAAVLAEANLVGARARAREMKESP